jgi:hypothetical protein
MLSHAFLNLKTRSGSASHAVDTRRQTRKQELAHHQHRQHRNDYERHSKPRTRDPRPNEARLRNNGRPRNQARQPSQPFPNMKFWLKQRVAVRPVPRCRPPRGTPAPEALPARHSPFGPMSRRIVSSYFTLHGTVRQIFTTVPLDQASNIKESPSIGPMSEQPQLLAVST